MAVPRIIGIILAVWLLIGVVAAVQRGYFSGSDEECRRWGTIAANVIAGPLNYTGLNPKWDCDLPQPSR